MAITPILYGTITEGKLIFENPTLLSMFLSHLNNKEVQIVIQKRKKERSLNQNAYYWKIVIGILSEHFGYFKDEVHEILKWKFLRVIKDNGLETVKSTAKLTTAEMEKYLEEIRLWASVDFQIIIPEPNENFEWT